VDAVRQVMARCGGGGGGQGHIKGVTDG
jgi:hypothetical protein